MIVFAQLARSVSDAELLVGLYGICLISGGAMWAFIRWFFSGPTRPEPWDSRVASELARGDCTPLCHHCLAPHGSLANFCPNCGAPVGTYTNLLPFPYLFSIGHALRIGTSEQFRRSPLTISGFFLLGLAEYSLFAPIYWFKLLKNLKRPRSVLTDTPGNSPPASPAGDVSPL